MFSLEKANECKFWYLQGNGFCDDSANTLDCNFDGGDCCGTVRKGQCEECACKQESQGNFGQKIVYIVRIFSLVQSTEVRFASFLSGGFITGFIHRKGNWKNAPLCKVT